MTKSRYSVYFVMVLVAAIMFGGIFSLLYFQSQDYVVEEQMVLDREQIHTAQQILSDMDYGEYDAALKRFKSEISDLEKYSRYTHYAQKNFADGYVLQREQVELTEEETAELWNKFGYTPSQLAWRLEILDYCVRRLEYAIDYKKYADDIAAKVEELSEISVFEGKMRKNILKTGRDFYGMENIRVSAEVGIGVERLLDNDIASLIAVVATVLCALLYVGRSRAWRAEGTISQGRLGMYTLELLLGISVLYAVEFFVCERVWGLGNFDRAVQSVKSFMTCQYMISVGEMMAVALFFRLLACGTIFLFCVGLLCCERKWMAVLTAAVVFMLELFVFWPSRFMGLAVQFHGEDRLGSYRNSYLYGGVINTGSIFVIFSIVLFLGAVIWALKGVRSMLFTVREEMEKSYFAGVNQRYTETRILRHDMNNHLTAVAMLMDEGKYQDARKYLNQVSVQLDETKPPVQTGIPVLDAVLFSKINLAKDKEIRTETDFQINFTEKGISEYDLCSLFGNILDNAIEACEKLKAGERKISLLVKRQMDMICVFCENPCLKVQKDNGGFVTQKEDKESHGFGLKQIERIARKYHGTVEMGEKEGIFSIAVLFQENR